MPHEIISLSRIEREAKAAAKKYSNINDACPHPFQSAAGKAFKVALTEARKEIEAKQVERLPGAKVQVDQPTKVQNFVFLSGDASPINCAEGDRRYWAIEIPTAKPDTLPATPGQEPGKVPPATIHAASTTAPYDGAELTAPAVRALADTPQGIPSRMGNQLRYRCGRVTDLTGNPITTGV